MGGKKNPEEEKNVGKTKDWGKAVDKTDKKIDDLNKTDKTPSEKLRDLLDDE